jgi:hypothetical protein
MTHTVEIESVQTMDVHGLLAALSAQGLVGEVLEAGTRFRLHVERDDNGSAEALAQVEHAIEHWLDERHVGLVPQRLGAASVVLRPPAA